MTSPFSNVVDSVVPSSPEAALPSNVPLNIQQNYQKVGDASLNVRPGSKIPVHQIASNIVAIRSSNSLRPVREVHPAMALGRLLEKTSPFKLVKNVSRLMSNTVENISAALKGFLQGNSKNNDKTRSKDKDNEFKLEQELENRFWDPDGNGYKIKVVYDPNDGYPATYWCPEIAKQAKNILSKYKPSDINSMLTIPKIEERTPNCKGNDFEETRCWYILTRWPDDKGIPPSVGEKFKDVVWEVTEPTCDDIRRKKNEKARLSATIIGSAVGSIAFLFVAACVADKYKIKDRILKCYDGIRRTSRRENPENPDAALPENKGLPFNILYDKEEKSEFDKEEKSEFDPCGKDYSKYFKKLIDKINPLFEIKPTKSIALTKSVIFNSINPSKALQGQGIVNEEPEEGQQISKYDRLEQALQLIHITLEKDSSFIDIEYLENVGRIISDKDKKIIIWQVVENALVEKANIKDQMFHNAPPHEIGEPNALAQEGFAPAQEVEMGSIEPVLHKAKEEGVSQSV